MSDTSEITTGCLVHYDSRHIQVRADFMGLCQYNRDQYREQRKKEPNQECMAKILRLLETLTDHARTEWKLKTMRAEEKGLAKPKEPEHYLIDLSNGGIVNLIYKTFGESTVRNSLNYLGAIGYIGTSQEKKNAIPSIWLEQDYVQSLLKLQAQVILAGYEFRLPSYQGAKSYPDDAISNPSLVISYPDPPKIDPSGCDITDNNITNKTDNNFKKTHKKRGSDPINLEVKRVEKRETNPRMPALSVSSHSQRLSETSEGEEDEEPTVKMPITKPQQPIPTTLLEAPAAPTVLPSPPKDGVQQGAMAMTARDIKKQAEKRAKELWVIIEDELHTTFTENQRKAHKDGIASLIADDISDEAMRTGLQALNTFERRTFTVQKFYGWLPTLSAKEPIFLKKASNGYQRDMVEWQGRYMTVEEADELGFNGGFGAYL